MAMTPKELTKAKIELYGELVCAPGVSAGTLGVAWLLLFKYLNSESGVAWPAAQTLADDLGASLRAVRYALNWLVEEDWFSAQRSKGRTSNRYVPNFSTVQATAPLTVQSTAPNRAKSRISTVQGIAPYTLEDTKEESLGARAARFATPDGDARGASLKTKKVCSAIKGASLENVLYYRRQELESGGRINHAALSNRDRDDADEWLSEHGEVGAEQCAVNGRQHAGSWVSALLAPEK
jgi:hypothetical protein